MTAKLQRPGSPEGFTEEVTFKPRAGVIQAKSEGRDFPAEATK